MVLTTTIASFAASRPLARTPPSNRAATDRVPTPERSLRLAARQNVMPPSDSRSSFCAGRKVYPCASSRRPGNMVTCAAVAENEPQATGTSYDDVGDGRAFAVAIAQEADMLKGKDIVVLHVAPLVSWTSYMVLVSTFSRPQMQAVLFKVGKMALEQFGRELPYSKQGSQGKDWECMDFGEVVVQVMTTESREYYDLESFYAAAEEVELPFESEVSQSAASRRGEGESTGWQKKL